MIREIANDGDGHPSITHYKSLYYDETRNISLVLSSSKLEDVIKSEFIQICMGHPLVGDGLYGLTQLIILVRLPKLKETRQHHWKTSFALLSYLSFTQ